MTPENTKRGPCVVVDASITSVLEMESEPRRERNLDKIYVGD